MLKTRAFWAIVLGVITCLLLFEAKNYASYSPLARRTVDVLTAPGSHVVAAVYPPGSSSLLSAQVWEGLSLSCNFLFYVFFWYFCIWLIGYLRARQHPYDRGNTLPELSRR
ncbi:MAG TPA: hypothetical protein VKD70_13290 [Candidatus Acidoferrum sp.]|nr:hypothetical protein [Candidatus Acidoferrum sp.]